VGIERHRELRRRRSRKKKMAVLKRKVRTASVSEKAAIAAKIRQLTPGSEQIIAELNLEER
jgi:hypothetical protein